MLSCKKVSVLKESKLRQMIQFISKILYLEILYKWLVPVVVELKVGLGTEVNV